MEFALPREQGYIPDINGRVARVDRFSRSACLTFARTLKENCFTYPQGPFCRGETAVFICLLIKSMDT